MTGVGERARVAPFVVAQLRRLDDELAPTIPRVLANSDTEAIHDMRVAIRRMRVLLRIARAVFGRFLADSVRQPLTHVHRATSALRDEEVLGETLSELGIADRGFVSWRERRCRRERSLRRAVLAMLNAGELGRARTLLGALVVLPVKPSRDRSLVKIARRAVEGARREVERRRDAPTSDAIALHELRIAFKNLRYACEIFADALPMDVAAMSKPAAQFQKRLGEIHDVDVAIASVRRARGLGTVQRAAIVELERLRTRRVDKYLRDLGEKPAAVTPAAQ
jgi:CHAD domain-containing protein